MSCATNEICVDLGTDQLSALQPLPRFVNLILQMALCDGAERIEFSLVDPDSETGFHIRYSGKSLNYEVAPAPALLFGPAVVVLCNYASVPYYAAGKVEGKIHTKRPDSRWVLQSDDLKKHVSLSKT
jgi:hypothetical protein